MLMVVLTGCSTFSIDKVKYYNEVLAKVGNDNITRFDLVNAYNNYGYTNYVTQGGQTESQALLSTMDVLVQRKMLVNYAKENQDKYSLSQYELKKLYRETLDYLLESMNGNKESARKIYGLDTPESSVEEAEKPETKKLTDYKYTSRVDVEVVSKTGEGGAVEKEYKLKFVDTDLEKDEDLIEASIDEKFITNFKSYSQDEIVKALLEKFMEEFYYNENNEDAELYKKVCDKAIELRCNSLINYEYYLRENGKKLSTSQGSLLFRFVERSYVSQLESAYITKVNNVYLQEEQLSSDSITKAFKALYQNDYAKYANDLDAYYKDVISTSGNLIYYHPTSDAEFGYFLHVLLPFNNVEDDLKWLKDHWQDLGYTAEEYKAEQMKLVNQITCVQRTTEDVYEDDELIYEEGVTLDSEVGVLEVLNEYNATVNDLNSFINFMFKYTTDTATLTADMPYVIGYNTVTDAEYSSMVANFTKEAIRLMKEDQKYTYSDEYILTNYGIHLLYYMGEVESAINVDAVGGVTVQDLDAVTLNEATGETYLDRVFDLVYPAGDSGMFTSNTKYSDFETVLIDSLYAKYPVKLYETKIKASNKI